MQEDIRCTMGIDGIYIPIVHVIAGEQPVVQEVINRLFYNPLNTWTWGINLYDYINAKYTTATMTHLRSVITRVIESVPGLISAEVDVSLVDAKHLKIHIALNTGRVYNLNYVLGSGTIS